MIARVTVIRLFSLGLLSGVITFTTNRFHFSHRKLQEKSVHDADVYKKNKKKIKRVPYADRKMKEIYKENLLAQREVSKITWKNLVVVILTYNNYESNKLIQAQFDTWIKK